MYRHCRDELICDMAEVYQIYDLKAYPVKLIAILAAGLGEHSRTIRKIKGAESFSNDTLLSLILDELRILRWFNSTDGQQGVNRPESVFNILYPQKEEKPADEPRGFSTPEQYEKARAQIIRGIERKEAEK